jgi:curved DNA-binding protein
MDHYAVLGVNKSSTPEEIKKAYRKLASQHHPDKGGDTAKFQKIQEAYAVLSDPEKKQQYDNPQSQGFYNTNFNQGVDINDLFASIFGQQHSGINRNARQAFRTQIQVTLLEAYTGTSRLLELKLFQGKKIVDINVPPGVKSGEQIRYDNLIPNSSLIVEFIVLADLKFDRKGNDLYCSQSISVLDLIVGTSFRFDSISGKMLQVNVKPLTQPYMQIKLSGQGMPIPNTGSYGDQYILLKPFIPAIIDDEIIDSILRSKTK